MLADHRIRKPFGYRFVICLSLVGSLSVTLLVSIAVEVRIQAILPLYMLTNILFQASRKHRSNSFILSTLQMLFSFAFMMLY